MNQGGRGLAEIRLTSVWGGRRSDNNKINLEHFYGVKCHIKK